MILTLPIGLTPKTRVQFKSFFWEVHFIRRSMLPTTFSSSSSYYYSLFFFFELNVIVFYSTLILLGNRVSCQRPFEQNKWALWVLHNNETPIHIKLLMLASSNSAWWWWYAKMRPNWYAKLIIRNLKCCKVFNIHRILIKNEQYFIHNWTTTGTRYKKKIPFK